MKKRQVRNIIVFFAVCILISLAVLGILLGTGVFYYDKGFHFSTELFNDLRNTFWIYPVFILIQIVITVFLCFVPGTSATMIGVAVAMFGANWKTFLICFIGVILSSFAMDLVGRIGGERIVRKLIDGETYDYAMTLIREKTYTYLPFIYLLPLFPDDAICFCAGVCHINLFYHYLIILLCRGIGIATIVFGISMVPFKQWLPITEHIYDWFLFGGAVVAYIMALLKISRAIDKKVTAFLEKRRKKNGVTTK